jgi:hypothetical protein
MNISDPTTTTVRVLLRPADQQVLSEAARTRKQSLEQFLSETLSVTAADLRQPPRVAVTWLDVYSHRLDPVPQTAEEDSEPLEPAKPSRAAR